MGDGTPWPGNNSQNHPGMIQVFISFSFVLIYVRLCVLIVYLLHALIFEMFFNEFLALDTIRPWWSA